MIKYIERDSIHMKYCIYICIRVTWLKALIPHKQQYIRGDRVNATMNTPRLTHKPNKFHIQITERGFYGHA